MESGLIQRARLLEAILADLYGPQTILRDGLLPPELVLGHPALPAPLSRRRRPRRPAPAPLRRRRRPWAGRVGSGCSATARRRRPGPATPWKTASSCRACCRTSSATATSSAWPCSSAPSARRSRRCAPHNRDNPRIVLLTPGPYNETYFEHAYLARYLGFTLVEGGDLTVRDSRVFLKVLGGLQPVDVIHRRLDDDFCDPLELRGDSFLGVPGLVQAVRAGNVAVANPLGSGLRRDAGPARLPAGPVPPSARRGAATAVRADVVVRRPGRPATTSWPTCRSWSSSRRSSPPAATRCSATGCPPRAAAGAGRPHPGPARATTSARNGCRCPRRRCWSATGFSRAAWSFAPT